ncbi:hypothetical protein AKO1_012023 [Acrasis kona]|uniref:AAA+ ATPase domain-containing protein n=1 Tax=Acrasis kona TaxID=1008807 RepID=A0AAW2ZB31_9EUKA
MKGKAKDAKPASNTKSTKKADNKAKDDTKEKQRSLTSVDYTSIPRFIELTRDLLTKEKDAEEQQMLLEGSKQTRAVEILEAHAGLSGRYNVKMSIKPGGKNGSSAQGGFLKEGESIQLRLAEPKEATVSSDDAADKANNDRGVVSISTDKFVIATMNGFVDDWWEQKVLVTRISDSVTFKRLTLCMNRLQSIIDKPNESDRVVKVCFGQEPHADDPNGSDFLASNDAFFNDGLNDSQRDAIRHAVSTKDVSLILGPPGTGKTTTVVELIRQITTHRRERIMVCAPSNVAVDNIVEKLSNVPKLRIVRMGHPARLMESVLKHSLDHNIDHGDGAKIVSDIRRDMEDVHKKIRKTRVKADKKSLRMELRSLQKELKEREHKVVRDVIDHSDVVLCTITGADDRYLRDRIFDWVIIDEAAQCVEAACWIPALKGRRLVLAGDPFQLPPTILSEQAKRKGLEVTLFERLYVKHKDKICRMLNVQYRMNADIMKWSSNEFYQEKLIAHESVSEHLLVDLKDVVETDETCVALMMIDTARCGMEENDYNKEDELNKDDDRARAEESKSNDHEARLVVQHVKNLLNAGISERDIAVITPYSAQVHAIKSLLGEELEDMEVGTVDGFQGREKEAVVISMVRSNPDGQVGFLSDERRTNVAITRARRHVCVVCDTVTLRTNAFLSRMTQYFADYSTVTSANDYL